MTSISLESLTPDAFAPFGKAVLPPGEEAHASGPGWNWWAEVAPLTADGDEWGFGYLDLQPTELRFDWAEYHLRTEEAVIATSSDIVMYVAEPVADGALPPLDSFRAFTVPPGAAVVLNRGVWHGAPFATDAPTSALVLILKGTGAGDVTVERFPDTPVEIGAH
jgi:ureidoglycolate lyase